MKKRLFVKFVVLIFSVCLLNCYGSSKAFSQESFGGSIILGRPTDKSVTVNVFFDRKQDSMYIEYGTVSGKYTDRTDPTSSIQADEPYEEVISRLLPDTRYFYRIMSKPANRSSFDKGTEHTFHTQRSKGSSYTFTIVADSHLFKPNSRYKKVLANCLLDNPDFHVDLGDTFMTDFINSPNYEKVLHQYLNHRPYFGILTHSAPLFYVLGNHDSEYLWYLNGCKGEDGCNGEYPDIAVWSTAARKATIPNPFPDNFYTGNDTDYGIYKASDRDYEIGIRESYYEWEWGDAQFIVLDPYWEMDNHNGRNWNVLHGDEQYEWFRQTVKNSTSKYIFVFEHHILGQDRGGVELADYYEWGGMSYGDKGKYEFDKYRPNWEKPFHALLVDKVNSGAGVIYFQGHDHLFAAGEKDSVYYVELPKPGVNPVNSPDGGNARSYFKSAAYPCAGHVRVMVSPEKAFVEYVKVNFSSSEGKNRDVAFQFKIGDTITPNGWVPESSGRPRRKGGKRRSR